MSALQQINISHEVEQDRLLLRASTGAGQEFRLWLTRRYAGLLAGVLQQQIDKAGGVHKLASDRQTTQQLRGGAFDHEYEGGRDFPLSEAGILGFGIKTSELANGNLVLQLLPKEGPGLNLTLDPPLLYLLQTLLEQAILQADWKLPLASALGEALH
jgi:hypothetical protein